MASLLSKVLWARRSGYQPDVLHRRSASRYQPDHRETPPEKRPPQKWGGL